MDKESLALLARIGLNQYESRAYLSLVNSAPATASEVSEIASIPRPRAYDILEGLSKKGFISVQPGRPVKFSAVEIDEAFSSLKKHKNEEICKELVDIDKIASGLKGRVKDFKPEMKEEENHVWVLRDRKNIYSKIESLISNANESILIATGDDELKRKIDTYENTLREAKKRGVNITIIAPKDSKHARKAAEFAKVITKPHNHRIFVADNHVVLYLTPDEDEKKDVGAWISSPYFAKNVRKLI
ncbi:TrmB family transcriptional regulator [Candidatus Micrarchaeota archaeon]|nr:TrmB family transcriptional regulator [Candidatus Micrarchaeota archaeon]